MYLTLEDELQSQIYHDPYSGCWLWYDTKASKRYGAVDLDYKGRHYRLIHRYMWARFRYDIPEGMNVCHTCDTPNCCNPLHLFVGTQSDNIKDAASKGRMSKKKTTLDVAKDIIYLHTNGMSYTKLADMFDLSMVTIYRICNFQVKKIEEATRSYYQQGIESWDIHE
jgi:hypothetical protein